MMNERELAFDTASDRKMTAHDDGKGPHRATKNDHVLQLADWGKVPVLYSTTTRAYLAEHLHRGTLVPSVGCLSSLVGRPPISSVFSIRYVDPPCAFRLPCRCVDVGGNPGGMEGPTVEGTEESPDRCRARGQDGPRRANGECCFYFPCRVPTFECRNK